MTAISEIHQFLSAGQDSHGQPLVGAFRSDAVLDRQIDELIGIIKGVMADGMVHQGEVEFLLQWLQANNAVRDKWPAKAIYPRLLAALADGVVDLEEEREIMELLMATVGGNTAPQEGLSSDSTSLPLTIPAPSITFPSSSFCFTGKFRSGTRAWCEGQVVSRGASIASVTKKLAFLVIGDIGSRDWIHSTHGRKIEAAIAHNESGGKIAIISEEHWFSHLTTA